MQLFQFSFNHILKTSVEKHTRNLNIWRKSEKNCIWFWHVAVYFPKKLNFCLVLQKLDVMGHPWKECAKQNLNFLGKVPFEVPKIDRNQMEKKWNSFSHFEGYFPKKLNFCFGLGTLDVMCHPWKECANQKFNFLGKYPSKFQKLTEIKWKRNEIHFHTSRGTFPKS